jgi:hypothetical protein
MPMGVACTIGRVTFWRNGASPLQHFGEIDHVPCNILAKWTTPSPIFDTIGPLWSDCCCAVPVSARFPAQDFFLGRTPGTGFLSRPDSWHGIPFCKRLLARDSFFGEIFGCPGRTDCQSVPQEGAVVGPIAVAPAGLAPAERRIGPYGRPLECGDFSPLSCFPGASCIHPRRSPKSGEKSPHSKGGRTLNGRETSCQKTLPHSNAVHLPGFWKIP